MPRPLPRGDAMRRPYEASVWRHKPSPTRHKNPVRSCGWLAARLLPPARGSYAATSIRWGTASTTPGGLRAGASVIIFDCNGVLVDSERIAAAVAAEEFTRIGIALTPELVARFFFGRRPADMIAMVETAGRCKLPASFSSRLAGAT